MFSPFPPEDSMDEQRKSAIASQSFAECVRRCGSRLPCTSRELGRPCRLSARLRAARMVAENRMACSRSSVMESPLTKLAGRGGKPNVPRVSSTLACDGGRRRRTVRRIHSYDSRSVASSCRNRRIHIHTELHGQVSGAAGAAVKLGLPGSTLESKIRSLKINKKRFKTTNL